MNRRKLDGRREKERLSVIQNKAFYAVKGNDKNTFETKIAQTSNEKNSIKHSFYYANFNIKIFYMRMHFYQS